MNMVTISILFLATILLIVGVAAYRVARSDSPAERARRRGRIRAKLDAGAATSASSAYVDAANAFEDMASSHKLGSLRSPDGPFWDSYAGDANVHYQGANYDSFDKLGS